MTGRLTELNPKEFTPRQQEIHDDIVARRGNLGGLFKVWLRNPELAENAQKLGAYCRYETALSPMLSELAILVVARHWRARGEWAIHAPIALKAGVPAEAIAAIQSGDVAEFAEPAAQIVHDYARHLLQKGRVNDDLHTRAVTHLTEVGIVDLVGLIGYYGLVALTLNAFEVPLPDGAEVVFHD